MRLRRRRDSDGPSLRACPCITIDLDAFWLEVPPSLAASATENGSER